MLVTVVAEALAAAFYHLGEREARSTRCWCRGVGRAAGSKVGPRAQAVEPQERVEGIGDGNGWRCSHALARETAAWRSTRC